MIYESGKLYRGYWCSFPLCINIDNSLRFFCINPCRTIQDSAFKCNIIIVDSLNNLVGEYLLKCCNSSGIHIPLRFKYGKDYQIIYFKIIYVNSDGMVRMFRILIIIEEWHINILESIVLQDFFYAIRPILIFFRTVVP